MSPPVDTTLTVRDLLLPGEPLDPADVVAGADGLETPVSWVVSLRPYPPAFPRLRGGELALVASDFLARLEPPTTLADVVRQLVSRDAAGLAVRGDIDSQAVDAAQQSGLPLIRLHPDAPLHDIEQAIMRVCALYQARREMLPTPDPASWVESLLGGQFATYAEALSAARRQGLRPATHYAVAFLPHVDTGIGTTVSPEVDRLSAALRSSWQGWGDGLLSCPWEGGLAVLVPQGAWDTVRSSLVESKLACGLGTERPLLEAPASFGEARMAATASVLLHSGGPVRYADMSADRLLILLLEDHPAELKRFVEETLGSLLRHDATAPTPLLPTLQAFLLHGGRLRETAAGIYVHRNTLAYRLERAQEVLGADLKDPHTRLALELALRALPLIKEE